MTQYALFPRARGEEDLYRIDQKKIGKFFRVIYGVNPCLRPDLEVAEDYVYVGGWLLLNDYFGVHPRVYRTIVVVVAGLGECVAVCSSMCS